MNGNKTGRQIAASLQRLNLNLTVDQEKVIREYYFRKENPMPANKVRPSLARRFRLADGVQVSTRSSKPRLRAIAKKLARQADKRAGVK